MQIVSENETLTVYLSGEIDHHSAKPLREKTDQVLLLKNPALLVLDFSGVSFMDSSGVGFVMGRYKKAASIHCKTAVSGLKARDRKIMALSGLERLVEFR